MIEANNTGEVPELHFTTRAEEMRSYDRLPRELRSLLANSLVQFSAQECYAALRQMVLGGMSQRHAVARIYKRLIEVESELIRKNGRS